MTMLVKLIDCLENIQDIKQNQLLNLVVGLTRQQLLDLSMQYQAATGIQLIQVLRDTKEAHWLLFELILIPQKDLEASLIRDMDLSCPTVQNFIVFGLVRGPELAAHFYEQYGIKLETFILQTCTSRLLQRVLIAQCADAESVEELPTLAGKVADSLKEEKIADGLIVRVFGGLTMEELTKLDEELHKREASLQQFTEKVLQQTTDREEKLILKMLSHTSRMDRICYLYHAFLQNDDRFTEKEEQAGLLMELFGLTFDEKPGEVRADYRRMYDADLLE